MSPKRTGYKILFIESSPQACEGIRAAFAKTGADMCLEFAPSPEAALEALKQKTVDAVFVNQSQSGMSAAEFLHQLSAINRRAPLVMRSLRADEDTVLDALREGAADGVALDQHAFGAYPAVARRAIARSETALQSAEQAKSIIRSQKQWMSILDAITDFIFVIDSMQVIVKVNNAFATAIGRDPRSIIGNQIRDVFDLGIPNETLLREILEDGLPRTYEKRTGDEIYQISIFPLLADDRQLTIHVMKNITEVRRLKDQLYHADKLASIGLLVSGVAHEINNPLTGTIAYTELLAMKVTDESTKTDLKKILDSAERCKKIINNLLTFSRQRTPSKSLASINDIIDQAIDLESYGLKSSNIEVTREFDPAATVFVDAQQMQQVFLNILVNARQAIMDSGHACGNVRFVTKYYGGTRGVVITIIDNGPGIPRHIAPKIFDPFFTTKPVDVGTGLGLSISRGIITEHGGSIRFEPGENGGASFTIELPAGTGIDMPTSIRKESA